MGRVETNHSQDHLGQAAPGALFEGWLPSILLDLAAIAVFVGVGRISHDESLSPGGLWSTGWPFLIGLAGGYLGVILTRWPAMSLRGGAMVAGKTIVLGLVIRFGIQQDDVPLSFAVVTAVVLAALILGWRLVAQRRERTADRGPVSA